MVRRFYTRFPAAQPDRARFCAKSPLPFSIRILAFRRICSKVPECVGKADIAVQMSRTAGGSKCPEEAGENGDLYIDPHFFNELSQRFGAKGDFAQAYVIAHEIGHHVQDLLGTIDKVHKQMGRLPKAEANRLSVRLELQADFYAGVFAREADKMFDFLEDGDTFGIPYSQL